MAGPFIRFLARLLRPVVLEVLEEEKCRNARVKEVIPVAYAEAVRGGAPSEYTGAELRALAEDSTAALAARVNAEKARHSPDQDGAFP